MANTENSREARFRIIETLLLWEGELDNQRLRAILGVQSVQASRILAEYAARNVHQIERASPRSPYKAARSIKPSYSSGAIDEYLALIHATDDVQDTIEDARFGLAAPMPRVFSPIVQACRRNMGVTIDYYSMTAPRGRERLIFPHSIVRAGRRWHTRAWCSERQDFRDFVIGRIRSAVLSSERASHRKTHDDAWNKKLPLTLAAHPGLDPDQARVIRDEYFSGSASRRLIVRSCLLSYVIQDLRAALDAAREVPPEYQLVVSNAAQIRTHLFSSGLPGKKPTTADAE